MKESRHHLIDVIRDGSDEQKVAYIQEMVSRNRRRDRRDTLVCRILWALLITLWIAYIVVRAKG